VYFVDLEGLQLRVSADVYLNMVCAISDKCLVSNALMCAGRASALILSKSYGARVTRS